MLSGIHDYVYNAFVCVCRWSGNQEQCHPVAMRQLVSPEGAREQ